MRWLFGIGILLVLPFLATTANATIQSRLADAQPSSLLMEDDSREFIFDADGNGFLNAGDALVGFAKVNQTSPPPLGGGNEIYAVFSQTFNPATFAATPLGPGVTIYAGTFIPTPSASAASLDNMLPVNSAAVGGFDAGAMIAFLDLSGGFSEDLTTVSLAGIGVGGKITTILDAEGTVQFTAGFGDVDDFFAFQTQPLTLLGSPTTDTDFVAGGIPRTQQISTSAPLGNFGAGLSVTDNFMTPFVTFNEVVTSTFFQSTTLTFFGLGNLYEVSVVNGNFGGIDESVPPQPGAAGNIQGGGPGELDFLNNADLVVNATVVPEPASLAIWGSLALAGLAITRFRRRPVNA